MDCGLRELGKCGLCGLAKCGLWTVSTCQVWTVDVKLGIVDLIMGCSVFQWACSKRRNTGMPEHRNDGTPECRNTGTAGNWEKGKFY